MLNVICETESSVEAAETGETSRDFILRGRDKNPRNIFTVLLPSCCFSKVSRMYNRCVYVRLCMYVLSCLSSVRVFLVGFAGIECGLRSKGPKSAQIFCLTSSKAQEEVSSQLFVTLG